MSSSSLRLLASVALVCLPACSSLFDDSLAGGDAAPGLCGNAVVDAGEACDDALPLTQTCATLVGPSATGNARCTACKLDLRGCTNGGGGASGRAGAGGATAAGGKAGNAGNAGAGVGGAGATSSAGFAGVAGQGGAGPVAGQAGTASGGAGGGGGAGTAGLGGVAGATTGGKGGSVSGAGGSSSGNGGSSGSTGGVGGVAGSGGSLGGAGGGGAAGGGPGGAGGSTAGAAGATSCAVDCGPFHTCSGSSCICPPDSLQIGAGCWPRTPKPAALRTKEEVCAARAMGNAELEPDGIVKVGGMCGPWDISTPKLADLANRLAYFRWLAGAPPIRAVTAGDKPHAGHARCAAATAYESGPLQNTSDCAGPETVVLSKRCSRITGTGADTPFDVLVRSETGASFGHVPRRILLSHDAGPFYFGLFAAGETKMGSCLEVPIVPATDPADPTPTIWPPAGFVPLEVADAPWSIGPVTGSGAISVSVVRSPPGTSLQTAVVRWADSTTGSPVALIERVQWVPVVARSYAVTLTQEGAAPLSYTFEPIVCGP